MQSRHSLGTTVRLYLDIIDAGAGVIAQIPTIAIQRIADGNWFQVSDGLWVSTKVENVMTETSSANLPGRYHFDFNQSLDLFEASTKYIVKKSTASGTLATEYEDLVFGPLAAAAAFGLCSIQGTIADGQGNPVNNALVQATIVPVFCDDLGRTVQSDRVISTYTNELGDFDLPIVTGATARLEIPSTGYDRKILVPDQASVLFTDL